MHSDDCPSVPVAELRGHSDGPIHVIRFTTDGRYCITGGNDRTVRLWNPTRIDPAYKPTTKEESSTISSQNYYRRHYGLSKNSAQEELPSALPMQTYKEGHMHPIHSVAVNSSSSTMLSCSDKTLVCTDLVTAQVKQKWWGHVARIEYVACLGGSDANNNSTGDDVYASASYDATVRLWDSRSRSKDPLMILQDAKDAVTCVTSVAGEAQIVTSSVDGKIRTYDLRTAQLITQDIGHPITSFSFGFDSTTYAASCLDGSIRLCDYQTNRSDHRKVWQTMNSLHKAGNYKLECAFTSNDKYVISGSECGAVVAYAVQDPTISTSQMHSIESKGIKLQRHTRPTCSVAACPQTSRPWLVLSASYDGSAIVSVSTEEAERCLED